MTKCKYCKEPIAFLRNKKGFRTPVEWESLNKMEKEDITNNLVRLYKKDIHVYHACQLHNYKGQKQ